MLFAIMQLNAPPTETYVFKDFFVTQRCEKDRLKTAWIEFYDHLTPKDEITGAHTFHSDSGKLSTTLKSLEKCVRPALLFSLVLFLCRSVTCSAFSTNTCAVVTSKQEAGEAGVDVTMGMRQKNV